MLNGERLLGLIRIMPALIFLGCLACSDSGGPDPGAEKDSDGDGYLAASAGGNDCNDSDPAIYPGADEICDQIDANCDGLEDDELMITVYQDLDLDGFGASNTAIEACYVSTGYAETPGDCDDNAAGIHPEALEVCDGVDNNCDGDIDGDAIDAGVFFRDRDGDGYGDSSLSVQGCSAPDGYSEEGRDCDDLNTQIHPEALEVCDGVDNDCDGEVDEGWDIDRDGVPDCKGEEVCDGVDNNLNGLVDEGFDGDGDGYTGETCVCRPDAVFSCGVDCDDTDEGISPEAQEVCDGLDNDCDGTIDGEGIFGASTWYLDADGDGYGTKTQTVFDCAPPEGYSASSFDCDDGDATVSPGAIEKCDHMDNDCDGTVDEGFARPTTYPDADGDGYGASGEAKADCLVPEGNIETGGDCDDSDPSIHPGAIEECDGSDNDCDGTTDGSDAVDAPHWYVDADLDTYGTSTGACVPACSDPSTETNSYTLDHSDCDDASTLVYPGAPEVLDEADNNCDGAVDDGLFEEYLDFDGIDDFVVLSPDQSPILDGPLTLEAWVRLNGPVSSWHASILDKWGDTTYGTAGVALEYLSATNVFAFMVSSNGRDVHQIAGTTLVEVGEWYHVAGTYDGVKLRLFVNGHLDADSAYTRGIFDNGLGVLVGGLNPEWTTAHYTLNGAVLEVRISEGARYSVAFSPQLPLAVDETTLLRLELNECAGQWAYNSSPSSGSAQLGSTAGVDDQDPAWVCSAE